MNSEKKLAVLLSEAAVFPLPLPARLMAAEKFRRLADLEAAGQNLPEELAFPAESAVAAADIAGCLEAAADNSLPGMAQGYNQA